MPIIAVFPFFFDVIFENVWAGVGIYEFEFVLALEYIARFDVEMGELMLLFEPLECRSGIPE